ncbi:hypothetical protein C0Q70_14272 [Pomacea canaliculata]|uniref:BPTI/Kunitz inhibitor domain-containing protein n=1 Tax=Pomacea canaliculata TaxID=400727 RepID=A0A2T7NZJ8_POMCA|nr:eppin-like isoform X2 [Pomacea canaliculata]PVD26595.1 hypothetical protein C0Q70_14272 [Pomacea canaliculata]
MEVFGVVIALIVIAKANSQAQSPPAGCTKSCPDGYLQGIYKTAICTCRAEKCKEVCQDRQCDLKFSDLFGEYPVCGTAEQIVVGLSDPQVDPNLNQCDMPAVTGRCRALIYRYYFDKAQQQCVKFIFGGCNGNDNNFYTKEECEQRCLKSKPVASPTQASRVLSLFRRQLGVTGK